MILLASSLFSATSSREGKSSPASSATSLAWPEIETCACIRCGVGPRFDFPRGGLPVREIGGKPSLEQVFAERMPYSPVRMPCLLISRERCRDQAHFWSRVMKYTDSSSSACGPENHGHRHPKHPTVVALYPLPRKWRDDGVSNEFVDWVAFEKKPF